MKPSPLPLGHPVGSDSYVRSFAQDLERDTPGKVSSPFVYSGYTAPECGRPASSLPPPSVSPKVASPARGKSRILSFRRDPASGGVELPPWGLAPKFRAVGGRISVPVPEFEGEVTSCAP